MAEAQIVGPLSRWPWEYIWLRNQDGPQPGTKGLSSLPPFLPSPARAPDQGRQGWTPSVHSFSVFLNTYYAPGAVRVAWAWAAKSKNVSAPLSVGSPVVLSKLLGLSHPARSVEAPWPLSSCPILGQRAKKHWIWDTVARSSVSVSLFLLSPRDWGSPKLLSK